MDSNIPQRVLLIPIDGKMPNLAIMKLSAWHKAQGDHVGLRMTDPDKIYISVIFQKNLPRARGIAKFYRHATVQIGGPALGSEGIITNLPDEVEHIMPDYDLYNLDFSMGYTTRGCIRKCPFCQIPKIEGKFREHASINEFHKREHKKIIIFDNNFLASQRWKEKLDYIRTNDLQVSFLQGLDARLVTREIAAELRKVKSTTTHFTSQKIYFAWDLMDGEDEILRGLQYILDAQIPPSMITVFMLVGYDTTHQEDLYRFKKLRELNVDPFVMIYNDRRDDSWIRRFSRYVNRWIYRTISPEKYKGGTLIE